VKKSGKPPVEAVRSSNVKAMAIVGKQTILLIEDDRAIRETIRQALEMEGFSVLTAEHGREGLAVLNNPSNKPSLILLDLMMPVMNGWEFMDALENDPSIPRPPIIITSAVRDRPELQRAVEFLSKPIELEILLEAIQKHLAVSPASD
jgi:two-component system, chemotaxis family, chemotaxis protein CheY